MNIEVLQSAIRLAGFILVCIAMIHIGLPRRFNWADDLPKLTGFNRHMFVVQCVFVAVNSFLMGGICLLTPAALTVKSLAGTALCLWFTAYWGLRLWCQFFVYPRELWVGKPFETAMHVLFSCIWIYIVTVFGCALFVQIA